MTSGRLESGRRKLLVDWSSVMGKLQNIGSFLRFNLKLSHKGIILVSVPLFFELLFLSVLATLLNQAEQEAQRLERSRAAIAHCNTVEALLYQTATTMIGLSTSGDRSFLNQYQKITTKIPSEFKALDEIVKNNPDRREKLKRAWNISNTLLDLVKDYTESLKQGNRLAALIRGKEMFQQIKTIVDQLIGALHDFVLPDLEMQREQIEHEQKTKQLVKGFLLIGIFFNVFLAFTVAIYFSKSVASRLGGVTENTRRLARGEPLAPSLPGTDEIAQLDRVFHDMAVALAEAARKERAVIDNAVDVICSIDADGKFTKVSPASLKLWGYAPEELIGLKYLELVLPDCHEETIRSFQEIMQGRSALPVENRTIRKDGSAVSVLWSAFWSKSEKSMFCVAHDITERKQAEDAVRASEVRIRQIIDSMPVGLVVVAAGGAIESVNPSMEQIFGYAPHDLIGQHLMILFPHRPDENPEAFMQQVFEKTLGHVQEREAVKSNGELFSTELSLKKIQTIEGDRFLANILDLTERKEVERLKREFVSTVSHELRTPLTAIRGSLTLITAGAVGELSEQMRRVVTIAERNTIRLIGLINDLLDLEKLEIGKLVMNFDAVPLSSVIERSVESVRAFGDQNGVAIETASTDAQVYADGDRLVQVIVNLLSNAVKFSPRGSSVTVSVKPDASWVEVSVIDRGRGIPEKYKDLLFQRFQQVEVADSKKRGGTGLGLAICKSIIEEHKGTIGVESEEGKGSTFWFKLPATDNSKG